MTDKLHDLAWGLVRAQGRMVDKWSEGDEAVKNDLWKALHTAGNELREYLTSQPLAAAADIWDDQIKAAAKKVYERCKAKGWNDELAANYSFRFQEGAEFALSLTIPPKPPTDSRENMLNRIAMQVRFHSISGKAFPETIDSIEKIVDEYCAALWQAASQEKGVGIVWENVFGWAQSLNLAIFCEEMEKRYSPAPDTVQGQEENKHDESKDHDSGYW